METRYNKDKETFSFDGTEIGKIDGMLCLSDLVRILKEKGLSKREISATMQRKKFRSSLSGIVGKDLTKSPNLVRDLKKMGLYKTVGRRENIRTYCDMVLFLCILSEYDYAGFFRFAFSNIESNITK